MDKVKVLYPARSVNTALKEGMICELLEIIPKEEAGAFTWPEYYVVKTPDNKQVTANSYRFERLKEV